MVYIPNSKISRKITTKDNQFFIRQTGEPYSGKYIQTSNGKFYAGHDNNVVGEELIENITDEKPLGAVKRFSNAKSTRKFLLLKEDIKNQLLHKLDPPVYKPQPGLTDYQRGYFQRFFFKRINSKTYLETNEKTYNEIIKRNPVYDYNLYEVGIIKWHIRGNNVFKQNALSIKKTSVLYPHINHLFPILNEYQLTESKTEEDLYTRGNELYYSDGKEYIGYYHIHPSKGPMVGAKHVSHPHDYLYYTNQLPKIANKAYGDFLKDYNKITCYKCFSKGEKQSIIQKKVSRLLGCPAGTYSTHDKALESCKETNQDRSDTILPTSPETSSPPSISPPTTPTYGGTTSGGGTSGGGGGGY